MLATANSGMSEMRFESGNIYFSDPDGIYVLSRFVIDGCDTGVLDQQRVEGEFLSEKIDNCAEISGNHSTFVICVNWVTKITKNAGCISAKDKGIIQSCVL